MVPDAVVGNSGVGGQQAPQRPQLAVVFGVCTGVLQLGAKSPQGQQNLAPVLWSVLIVIEFLQQRRKVVEATLLDVVDLGVCQLLQVQSFAGQGRSEEHTSELQSRGHLVCRLLLEITRQTERQ